MKKNTRKTISTILSVILFILMAVSIVADFTTSYHYSSLVVGLGVPLVVAVNYQDSEYYRQPITILIHLLLGALNLTLFFT